MNPDPNAAPAATGPNASGPPLELADFLERCMGDTAVATLVLDKFEIQLRAVIEEIECHLSAQEVAQIASAAHALKGSAGATSAPVLQTLAAKVEGLARQNEADSIAQELSALRAEVDRCLGYLPAARSTLRSGADDMATKTEAEP